MVRLRKTLINFDRSDVPDRMNRDGFHSAGSEIITPRGFIFCHFYRPISLYLSTLLILGGKGFREKSRLFPPN